MANLSHPVLEVENSVFDPAVQRANAMQRANATRTAIKDLKDELRSRDLVDGCRHAAQFLRAPQGDAAAIRTRALLTAIYRMGTTRANQLLASAGIANGDKRVRDLTPRQRLALAERLLWRARW